MNDRSSSHDPLAGFEEIAVFFTAAILALFILGFVMGPADSQPPASASTTEVTR